MYLPSKKKRNADWDKDGSSFFSTTTARDYCCSHTRARTLLLLLLLSFVVGVPTPAQILQQQHQQHNHSVFHNTPLDTITLPPAMESPRPFLPGADATDTPSPLTTMSIQLLLGKELTMNVALVQSIRSSASSCLPEDESSPLGTVSVFALHTQHHSSVGQHRLVAYTLRNVPLRTQATTVRKLLWRVASMPIRVDKQQQQQHQQDPSCDTNSSPFRLMNQSGHLLLTDEDDGYRLAWFSSNTDQCTTTRAVDWDWGTRPKRNDIVTCSWQESSWERVHHNSTINLTWEAYLHVDALLNDIRCRRPKTFHYYTQPHCDFSYDLVSFQSDAHCLTLVIVFVNNGTAVSVVVTVHVLTQRYQELEWGQCSNTTKVTAETLAHWSSRLATNRRLGQLHMGPFGFPSLVSKPSVKHFPWNTVVSDDTNCTAGTGILSPAQLDATIWTNVLRRVASTTATTTTTNNNKHGNAKYRDKNETIGTTKNMSGGTVERKRQQNRKSQKTNAGRIMTRNLLSHAQMYPSCDAVLTNDAIRRLQPVRYLSSQDGSVRFVYG